ncbi:MAG: glycosyltransferase [Bacilli bacterium]|nr:glycosyltransferase [Bacilli bacterium]
MNLLKKYFKIKNNSKLKLKRVDTGLELVNDSDRRAYCIITKPIFSKGKPLTISSLVDVIYGSGCQFKIVNTRARVIDSFDGNTTVFLEKSGKMFFVGISVEANSKVLVKKLDLEFSNEKDVLLQKEINGDVLLMCPNYPSESDRYNCAFVHTRVEEYVKLGWNINVVVVSDNYINRTEKYSFEGIPVIRTGYNDIRKVLQVNKFKKILIHFFNEKFAQVLDASNLENTSVFLYSHGADTMYWDWEKMCAPYFSRIAPIDDKLRQSFQVKDEVIKRYNDMENVKWVFVTDFTKNNSEKLLNIKYKNYAIVPCLVDENKFKYKKRSVDDRKKICMIRKFNNINSYSIDIDIRVILELSRRDFFNELEFSIYGDGEMHDILLAPVKKFPNVHIYKKFLSHDEMGEMYRNHGIALFATRYDSQAVASCEAAMTGAVVVTSKNVGVTQFIDPKIGTYCDTEDYVQYANVIEDLYKNKDKFLKMSKQMHESVVKTCGYDQTIKKDIELIQNVPDYSKATKYPSLIDKPVITIAIPSYNVAKYLKQGVFTLIDHEFANKVEVIIINDGSKDNTIEVAKEIEKFTKSSGKNIVKVVDKENGGHGSTINKGIELATGKYFKLMDGDDYFVTSEFVKLIEVLENEDSDIILTNYIEDFAIDAIKHPVHHYDFMIPGLKYKLDDMGYEGYGFFPWGPLLSTSTYKTDILKKANFKIDEKCFYVDMEYNFIGYVNADTVVYYPLDIYNYYLGRAGQSVSKESYIRNCSHHEKVCLRLVEEYEKVKENISDSKKRYLLERIIIPMCKMQYDITIEYFNNSKMFKSYDKKLKKYPYFYNLPSIAGKRTRLHRATGGKIIFLDDFIKKIIDRVK